MNTQVKEQLNRAARKVKGWAICAQERGSEIVQTVIVLGFAVGLGVALIALQGNMEKAIDSAGSQISNIFSNATDYQAPKF